MAQRKKLTLIYHYRRCHVCGTVNALENAYVNQCEKCKKYFAPFYFFEESDITAITDLPSNTELTRIKKKSEGYQPLLGFSLYWED